MKKSTRDYMYEYNTECAEISFVSYDGAFPNLCSGVLTLEINGVKHSFGIGEEYPIFWCSGGHCYFDFDDEGVEHKEWQIVAEWLPYNLQQYAQDMKELFNENVPYGCCGGCI